MVTKVGYACAISVLGSALNLTATIEAQAPSLSVDAAANLHSISPYIYGIASYGLDPAFATEIKVPAIRWGGDGASRYNWEVDSSNSGNDWYFTGGNGESDPVPGAQVDTMITTYRAAGAGALVTIPIIPYVNKSAAYNCSFPTSVYGAQQSTNPYVHPNGENCGNGVSSAGSNLLDTSISANNLSNTTALQQSWIEHLVATFGTAAAGGVPFYQLDNEPDGWGNTHRDIEPHGATYPTIASLGEQYAAAIKQIDPTAKVFGPSDFTLGGWIGTPSQQNNLMAGQYYLQQMAAYSAAHAGARVLDYFDEHYYPPFTDVKSQLASTRSLWDPTYNAGTWVEQYYFYGPMQLIPRFQSWIGTYYPGTKLAISEYSIDSGNGVITDGLAEADVLGIFGREQLDFATMWSAPGPSDPIAYAFRLFRNYDGWGSQFGDTSVSALSTNQAALSIYGATRSSDGALTLVVINKTTASIYTKVTMANYLKDGSAGVYSYSSANPKSIAFYGNVSLAGNELRHNFPAYSATVIVLGGKVLVPPPAPPLVNGRYVVTSVASSLALDDPGWSTVPGTQADEYSANGGENQEWTFTYTGGYYTIRNEVSGMLLTDPGVAGETTGALEQYATESNDTQLWSLTGSSGNWVLHNKQSGLVIADPNSSKTNLTGIVVEKQAGGTNESWTIQ